MLKDKIYHMGKRSSVWFHPVSFKMNSIFLVLADADVQFLLCPPHSFPFLPFPPIHLLIILEYCFFRRRFLLIFIYHLLLNTFWIFHRRFVPHFGTYVFLNFFLSLFALRFLHISRLTGHPGHFAVAEVGKNQSGEEFELSKVTKGVHGNNFNMKKGMSNKLKNIIRSRCGKFAGKDLL